MISPVTRLSHVALRTPDVQRLGSYYTEVVGLTPYDEIDGVVFLASGGYGPALELRPSRPPAWITSALRSATPTRMSCLTVCVTTASAFPLSMTPSLVSAACTKYRTSKGTCSSCASSTEAAGGGSRLGGNRPDKSDISRRGRAARRRSPSSTSRRSGSAGQTGWATSSSSCAATPITTPSISSTRHGPASCTTSLSSSAAARSC